MKINDLKTGVNRPNAAYLARALPKRRVFGVGGSDGSSDWSEEKIAEKERVEMQKEKTKRDYLRVTTPGIDGAKKNAREKGKAALHQLEDMLDNMNDRMEDIEGMNGEGRARTAGIASQSGDRAIGELVSMVNNVVDKLS